PRTFEKRKKSSQGSVDHQNSRPRPSSLPVDTVGKTLGTENDFSSIKDLATLRALLGDVQDQNEKRRIRHAMRQLRERERSKQSNGVKSCGVNGRRPPISRTQSLTDWKVTAHPQGEVTLIPATKHPVKCSSSFTSRATKQKSSSENETEKLSADLIEDHEERSRSIKRWRTRTSSCERRQRSSSDEDVFNRDVEKSSVRNRESNIHSSQSSSPYTEEAHHRLQESKDSGVFIDAVQPVTSKSLYSQQCPSTLNNECNSGETIVNNSLETETPPKSDTVSRRSQLKVTLKNSSLQRRNSEPVVVNKKLKPKHFPSVNCSSNKDREFNDWLESKKKKLSLPVLEFGDLNSTKEMEAAFTDILDEVDKHSSLSDDSTVDSPIEETDDRDSYENRNNLCHIEVRDKQTSNQETGTVVQEDGLNGEPSTNHSQTNEGERECNNNIKDINTMKSNMELGLSQYQKKDGTISVIEGDDGSITIHQVTQDDLGDNTVTEVRRLRRTESCTQEEEKDRIIESKITSPGGTSVYQKDITKTKKKLTARGSEYFSRNNAIIKRIKKRDGPEYVEHDVCIESENFSATKGESWGDKSVTQVQLNRTNSQVKNAIEENREADSNGVTRVASATAVPNHLNVSKTSSGYGSEDEPVTSPPAVKPAGSPEVVCPLKDIRAPDGSTCSFECVVFGSPAPVITWYQNNERLEMLDTMMTSYDETSGKTVLEFSDVTPESAGEYRCVFKNILGEAESAATLKVDKKHGQRPVFTKGLQDITVDEGHSVVLECTVNDCQEIVWYKDGVKSRNSADFKQTYNGSLARLEICELILSDSGEYVCVGRNEIGEAKTACRISVKECLSESAVVPMFLNKPSSQIVGDQEQVVFECDVIGSPQPAITWLKDGDELGDDHRVKMSYDGRVASLKMTHARLEDSGKYDCVAENPAGRVSANALLVVRARRRGPAVVQELSDATVTAGDPFTFQCSIMGNPRPTILWRKDQCMIGNTKDFLQTYNDNIARCVVSEIYPQDGGLYQCVATNSLGEVVTSCRLCVKEREPEQARNVSEGFTSLKVLKKWTPSNKNLSHKTSDTSLSQTLSDTALSRTSSDTSLSQNSECQSAAATSTPAPLISSEHRFQRDATLTSYSPQITSNKKTQVLNNHKSQVEDQKSMGHISPQNETLIPYSTQTSNEKNNVVDNHDGMLNDKKLLEHRFQHDDTLTSCSAQITSKRQKPTQENPVDVLENQKSNSYTHKTFTSWQPKAAKNNVSVRRTESLNMPRRTKEKDEVSENHQTSSKDIVCKSLVKDCNFHKSNSLIDKFEKMSQEEQKPKAWTGVKLRRTESARLAPKETSSPLWKNLLKKNTDSCVNKDKPVEVQSAAAGAQLLFQCNTENNTEDAFRQLAVGVTETPVPRETSLTRTLSLKILPTRKHTELSRSGSLHLPGDDGPSAVRSAVAQKRQFWEASAKMPSYDSINDEEELHKLMNKTEDINERKKIRARIRELHEIRSQEYERKKQERERGQEDAVKKKFEQAELAKKRQLQAFQDMAAKPTSDRLDKYASTMDAHIKEKHAQADADKKKTLEAYDRLAADRACGGKSYTTVSTEKTVGPGGSTTTVKKSTTVTHTSGVGGTSYGRPAQEIIANQIARQLIGASGPNTGGRVTVKTESWNSRDDIVDKTQKSESWGAKPPGAGGATSNVAPAGGAPAAGGGVRVTRNPSAIKQLLLDWCKAKTAGYENVNVTNFSSSWNNGMAFCALIHHFYPESFDFKRLNPKNRRYNFNMAFDTAEKYADIAPLLDTDDMVRMKNPDWKCVFTYVQSFYRHLKDHDANKAA
ncbi:hypothetical protein ScPMuIL_006037, partial [Solemya velum]